VKEAKRMATVSGNEARIPVTCTIETDTTTIEVVATEAYIEHEGQVLSMATEGAANSVTTQVPSRNEVASATTEVKLETSVTKEGGEEGESTMYDSMIDAVAALDAEVLLEAVGLKILRHYSLWDLMLTKARSPEVDGTLPLLINDTERVLLELKVLLESTMEYVPARVGRKKRNRDSKELAVTEILGAALCVEPGLWKMKNVDDINYDNPMLDLHRLLPLSKYDSTVGTSDILGSANVITDVNEPLETAASGGGGIRRVHANDGGIRCRSTISIKEERNPDEETGLNDELQPTNPDRHIGYAVSSSGRRIKRKAGHNVQEGGFREESPLSGRRGRPRKMRAQAGDPGEENDGKYFWKAEKGLPPHLSLQGNEENEPKSSSKVKKARLKYKKIDNKFSCKYSDCTKSDVRFKSRSEFEQHFLNDHATEDHKFISCLLEDCQEMFALTSQRNSHMNDNHERLFSCELCDRKFFREVDVTDHARRSHPVLVKETVSTIHNGSMGDTDGSFDPACVCSRCGKKFASKAYVDNHERSCDGMFVRQPKFTQSKMNGLWFCQEKGCPTKSSFDCEYALRMHFYDNHLREEEKIFVCDYCNQHFALRTLLNKHVDAAHLKRFQCDWCGRRFGGKDKLKTHTYTHTGEKPYACDKCDYRTAKKYNLDTHKQSKHQDFQAKSHYCELCGKGFCTQGRVRQHKKVIHREGRVATTGDRRKRGGAVTAKALPDGAVMAGSSAQIIQVPSTTTMSTMTSASEPTAKLEGAQVQPISGTVVQHVTVTEQDVEYITTELTDQAGIVVGLRY